MNFGTATDSWRVSLWPPVEYGHIFCYFVERRGVFTRSELMHWKVWKLITTSNVAMFA